LISFFALGYAPTPFDLIWFLLAPSYVTIHCDYMAHAALQWWA
jgi:hypothetical protein